MDYIQIGKIINTHGIKGEVKVYPLTDNVCRFKKLKIAYLGHNRFKVIVEDVKYFKNTVILKFEEFDNINEILQYKGDYIYIDEKDKVTLPEGHFFLFDIIGCNVFTNKGKLLGTVSQIMQTASNDVYVVKDTKKNKEYMIPAVKNFFELIDVENKQIIIKPIKGMIE